MRTLVVALIIAVSGLSQVTVALPTRPNVVQGTPTPIERVPTEDCPDVARCDR